MNRHLSRCLLAAALLSAACAWAKPPLPFVGERSFRLPGCSASCSESVHIQANGRTTLTKISKSDEETVYRGPYRRLMPNGNGTYLKLSATQAWITDKNGRVLHDCSDDEGNTGTACTAPLEAN